MIDTLKSTAQDHGDRLAAMSMNRLIDLKTDFENINMDTSKWYDFTTRDDLGFEARSVLAVASPSPSRVVTFSLNGKNHEAIIPPTYMDYINHDLALNKIDEHPACFKSGQLQQTF